MITKYINKLLSEIPQEERKLGNFKEIPCKDMDLDCLALDGRIPFGNYRKCYEYAPELGRCIFCDWQEERSCVDE
jgi:hypothetical protein